MGPACVWDEVRPALQRAASNMLESAVSDFIISHAEFLERLHAILPVSLQQQTHRRSQHIRLRDQEFNKITTLLKLRGKEQWALRPRTYVVLYMIGLEQHMDAFVTDERSDFFLPYTEDNLPDSLTGDHRKRFLEYQANVLDGQGVRLESGRARHQNCHGDAQSKFFDTVRRLGQGGSQIYRSQVDLVVGKNSLRRYALKTIPRQHIDDTKDKRILKLFENELQVLKLVDHQHIVKVVGSYTDARTVGILMQPVADQDLAAFLEASLSGPSSVADRQMRIRNFFGCIATAVDYLHNNSVRKVQHKDIKPKNILVKGSTVYLTDFGTAQLWHNTTMDDTGEIVTNPSLKFFSKRYAPIETITGTRTDASDMWSLGCVFVEMLTVLAGNSMSDLHEFFRDPRNGTGSTAYHENEPALAAWFTRLRSLLSAPSTVTTGIHIDDTMLVDITEALCQTRKEDRLTARDLVRRIFKLEGPYQGLCCSDRLIAGPKCLDSHAEISHGTSPGEFFQPCESAVPLAEGDTTTLSENDRGSLHPIVHDEPISKNYAIPSVEDADTTTMVVWRNTPSDPRHIIEDVTQPMRDITQTSYKGEATLVEGHESDKSSAVLLQSLPKCDFPAQCQWPKCGSQTDEELATFSSLEALRTHIRDRHLVHDFGRTSLCGETQQSKTPMRLDEQTGRFQLTGRPKVVRFADSDDRAAMGSVAPYLRDGTFARPTKPAHEGIRYSIKAEMPRDVGVLKVDGNSSRQCRERGIPSGTYAPSYVLASQNRFSPHELQCRERSASCPLFVYGSLMFPSILRSQANKLMNPDGHYSKEQGLRLRTTAADWGGIELSLLEATRHMTPALIEGFARFRLPGKSLAYLRPDLRAQTTGFLVYGLSEEALACLDHLYESGGPNAAFQKYRRPESLSNVWQRTQIARKPALAMINTDDGQTVEVLAQTYVVNNHELDIPSTVKPWKLDDFINSSSFDSLSRHAPSLGEEEIIAENLGTRLAMPGDHIVDALLHGSERQIEAAIWDAKHADARCAFYGTPLQAAAALGNVGAMRMLLEDGARIDAVAGEHSTALIAAVVGGHFEAMQLLLDRRARLFGSGGRYVSALYQAVAFDRVDMAHALLEKGAWLTTDYSEVLDLANERGNVKMQEELSRYHVLPPASSRVLSRMEAEDKHSTPVLLSWHHDYGDRQGGLQTKQQAEVLPSVGFICLMEALKNYNKPGKWTGIKLVRVLRAGFESGLDPKVLELIRDHVHSFPALQNFLVRTMGDLSLGGKFRPIRHGQRDDNDVESWHKPRVGDRGLQGDKRLRSSRGIKA
ncbi:hypothetical protein Micbo1qcDRAFT_177513 [Microdochium bolleyi]|uniref:non-specific serine/threonine protein kinase n=1 Tax=Microdochium bolleyi TaxID=196109 RepID=A0A136IVS8_9PEZI|nr:hypothetical protein Micbo1qcDRAFT_177513 [Microdochium bolleyi]